MEFKVVERNHTATLTKRYKFAKQNNFLKSFGNIKITGSIKIKLTTSLTQYLAFRIFDWTSNFLALIILQPEIVQLNVTKSRCSGGPSADVANIFMRGGRKSDIMDFLY